MPRASASGVVALKALLFSVLSLSSAASAQGLRISEVGNSSYYVDVNGRTRSDVPVWFEIINTGSAPATTSGYRIRVTAADKSGKTLPAALFDLPDVSLPPKGVFVFRARRLSDDSEDQDSLKAGRQIAYLDTKDGSYPSWKWSGFLELMRQGQTIDFVRWGANTHEPTTAGQWQGENAAAMPYGQNRFGYALARDILGTDSNAPADWTLRHFATPGGPNDVTCDDDAEGDGFPDCSEQPGSTYSGLPIYDWGARTGARDIFVEVDYMLHDQDKGPTRLDDPGTIPQRAALERVRDAFKAKGIAIHFDTGSLFHPAAGISPPDFDLGGGNAVPFKNGLRFGKADDMTNMADIYDYKRRYMDYARRQVFHYLVFAHTQNAAGDRDSSGVAELPGNDFMVTLGAWGLNAKTDKARNALINFQAGTLMHELGHNLGLRHGGVDHGHEKTNYLSIMNYLYQLDGLPDDRGDKAGDRHFKKLLSCDEEDPDCPKPPGCSRYVSDENGLQDSFESDPAKFRIDYSDGSGGAIDEDAIDERKGMGRPGGAPIDFNCDGTISETPVSFNLDADPEKSVIRDFNDWSSIKIFFQRTGDGDRSGLSVAIENLRNSYPSVSIRAADKVLPIAKDTQPTLVEPKPPADIFARIKDLNK